eukprot:3938707-Rhodomonas_salina.1
MADGSSSADAPRSHRQEILPHGTFPFSILPRCRVRVRVDGVHTIAEMQTNVLSASHIEGSHIDFALHANDAGAAVHEALAFDEAVDVVMTHAHMRNRDVSVPRRVPNA